MNIFLKINFFLFLLITNINCGNTTCFEYSCDECDSPEYGKCTKCRKGFRLVDGTCPCTDAKCALCTTGLAGLHICTLCKNGNYRFNKDCYCDIKDCELCSSKSCIICKTGYFYNSTSNACEEQKDEDKLPCYDNNCDACFTGEQGGCEYCKEGYTFEKGECFELSKPNNNKCPDGYYLKDDYCEKKCGGVECSDPQFYYFLCPINKCLVCTNNELQIFSECDNSQNCTMEGCLNCITNDECLVCTQGYYLLYGQCIKCTNGCSICTNNDTCLYCLSGYELNSENKCELSNNFDFNLNKYNKYKNQLIKANYPNETINNNTNIISEIIECDQNCAKCYDNTGVCKECNTLYIVEDNKCVKHCSDNCLQCSLINGNENCDKCAEGYIVKSGKCIYNCTDKNCLSCKLENETEICDKCALNYHLNDGGSICKADFNYVSIIFAIIGILIILLAIISFCLYRKRKNDYIRREIMNLRNNDSNSVNVYGRNNGLENSGRIELNREEVADEYEKQKSKKEKANQMCQFCKKKLGKFQCDCGCIVCKEHSVLKIIEKNGEKYNACLVCDKPVKKVSQIKYDCNICLQKKLSVAHFKCECSLEVCKDCYIKCKMSNEKCPQCRNEI